MVKGISRQVILIHSPEPKLFEQAIFILREDAQAVTDDQLMKEANRLIREGGGKKRRYFLGPLWAAGGALVTGAVWALSLLF